MKKFIDKGKLRWSILKITMYLDEEYLKICSANSTWLNKLA